MWKEFSENQDGIVFWGCLLAGLVLILVDMMGSR